jgi:hypothetical protein
MRTRVQRRTVNLSAYRTSGTGSRTDVWRSSEGQKGIWRATRTVRGTAREASSSGPPGAIPCNAG